MSNNLLNVKAGDECTISANSIFKTIDARGKLIIGDDVKIQVQENFSSQADLTLGARSLIDANRIVIAESTVTLGLSAELRSRTTLNLFENVAVDAPNSGTISATEYSFGHNIVLNDISYPDYIPRFIKSSNSYVIPTPNQLVAFLDSSLMLLETAEGNASPTAQKLLYQQMFVSQVQAATCQTVYVEVKETLDTVYSEFEVVKEEAVTLAVKLEETEEEVKECGNLLGACEIYVYENKYDTTLPSPVPIPNSNEAKPVVIPPDLTFRYVLQIEKSTGGAVTENDISALKAAVINQLSNKLAVPKTSVVIGEVSLVGTNLVFSINIVTPALASLAFAQETGVRLTAVPAEVLFGDIPNTVPSFVIQSGHAKSQDTSANLDPMFELNGPSVPNNGRSIVIFSVLAGVVGALVGAAVVAVYLKQVKVQKKEKKIDKHLQKVHLAPIDVNIGVTQLKL